jgi:small subunit ribosomal protein S2
MKHLLQARAHIGHRISKYNPKMAKFVYGQKQGIHIIDIIKTVKAIQQACVFVQSAAVLNKKILFVGTHTLASSLVVSAACECNGFFINHRWVGGFLTNWQTMQRCIQRLNELQTNTCEQMSKKEILNIEKQKARLNKFFGGVSSMEHQPDIVVIVGQNEEKNAVKECQKVHIPNITIVDTDCNPELADYPIPANDDSFYTIQFVLHKLVQAYESTRISS